MKLSTLVWPAARYSTAAVGDGVGPGELAAAAAAGGVAVFTAVSVPSVVPIGVPVAETRWTSVRSTSVKLMTPLSVRCRRRACSVTAPARSCAVITGASLVPVMVTVTVWVVAAGVTVIGGRPCRSASAVSPAAR